MHLHPCSATVTTRFLTGLSIQLQFQEMFLYTSAASCSQTPPQDVLWFYVNLCHTWGHGRKSFTAPTGSTCTCYDVFFTVYSSGSLNLNHLHNTNHRSYCIWYVITALIWDEKYWSKIIYIKAQCALPGWSLPGVWRGAGSVSRATVHEGHA